MKPISSNTTHHTLKMIALLLMTMIILSSCNQGDGKSDAYGNFEATEVIVSSEASDKLLQFSLSEGQQVRQDAVVGYIDTTQLYLKKMQLLANRKSIASKTAHITAQVEVLKEEKAAVLREQARFTKLVPQKAATQKELDDINSRIDVIDAQIKNIQTQHAPVFSEIESIDMQVKQINDQIQKSIIRNPVHGTVLVKYTEENEITSYGKPLYKVANLDTMTLRVYVSGAQLPSVKIGQDVAVLIDNAQKEIDSLNGTIAWIASDAEFTPKTVQTRDERVNLVYAVKVSVPNDGTLKIGMPGEIRLSNLASHIR